MTAQTAHQQVHQQLGVFGLGVVVGGILSIVYSLFALLLAQQIGYIFTINRAPTLAFTPFDIVGSVYLGLCFGVPLSIIPTSALGGLTGSIIDTILSNFQGKLSPLLATTIGILIPTLIGVLINGVIFTYVGSIVFNQWSIVFLLIPSLIYIGVGGWAGWFLYTTKYQTLKPTQQIFIQHNLSG